MSSESASIWSSEHATYNKHAVSQKDDRLTTQTVQANQSLLVPHHVIQCSHRQMLTSTGKGAGGKLEGSTSKGAGGRMRGSTSKGTGGQDGG